MEPARSLFDVTRRVGGKEEQRTEHLRDDELEAIETRLYQKPWRLNLYGSSIEQPCAARARDSRLR